MLRYKELSKGGLVQRRNQPHDLSEKANMSLVWRRVVICAAASAALLSAPSARAGEYHVYGCREPDGDPIGTDGWAITESSGLSPIEESRPPEVAVTSPSWTGWVRSCAAGGSFGAVLDSTTVASAGGSRFAVLRFAPGGGLVITRGSVHRAFSSYDTGRAELLYQRPGSGVEVISNPYGRLDSASGNSSVGNSAVPLWPANRFDFPVNDGKGSLTPPAAVDALWLRVSCGPVMPCAGASAQVFRSDLVLSDTSGPTVDLVGGTVFEQSDLTKRVLKGTESVTVASTDVGSGVSTLRVEIDGRTVGEAQFTGPSRSVCRWGQPADDGLPASTLVRPCPPSGSGTAAVDTTSVSDGRRSIRVLALDGSGAATVVAEGQVLVRNTDKVGPGSPDEFRGAVNGKTTSEQATLDIGWVETARPASKSKSVQRRCKRASYRRSHKTACDGRPATSELVRGWSRTKTSKLIGRLRGEDGQPISDAVLDLAYADVAGVNSNSLGTTKTDAEGSFSVLAARSAGTRVIQVGWRARHGDTVTAAGAGALLKVKAGSTFRAQNLGVGRTAKFSGRVVAGDLVGSQPRPAIRLQWLANGRWATFESAHTDERGRWTIRRKLNVPARYRMRVVVEDSPRGLFDGDTGPARTISVS